MSATTSTTPTPALTQQQIANLATYATATAVLMGIQQVTPDSHLPLIEKALEDGRAAIMAQVTALMVSDPVLAAATSGPELKVVSALTAEQGLVLIKQLLETLKV